MITYMVSIPNKKNTPLLVDVGRLNLAVLNSNMRTGLSVNMHTYRDYK